MIDHPPALLKEITFAYGIGFRNTGQTRSYCLQLKKEGLQNLLL